MSQNIWIFIVVLVVILGIALVVMSSKKKCKYYKENGKCVDECKNKIWDFTTQSCVVSCPSGTEQSDSLVSGWNQCLKRDEINNCITAKAIKVTPEGFKCLDGCSIDDLVLLLEQDKKLCIERCNGYIHPVTFKCLDSCSGDFPYETTETDSNGNNYGVCSDVKQQ